MLDFSGQTIVITGAAGGIGRALVARFQELGADIVACDRDAEGLASLPDVRPSVFDLTDRAAMGEAISAILRDGPPPAAIISNAGITRAETMADVDDAAFDTELAQNLTGAATLSRLFLPSLRKTGGAFVFVSSVNALAHYGNPAYSAAKAGLNAWMRAIAVEEGIHGIRANAVIPGSVHTNAWTHRIENNPRVLESVRELYPLGRMVTPQEVANAVAFLASPLAGGITGTTLNVDGGISAGNLPFLKKILEA
ncbi:SDR family oxidoreductase [Oceaniglobus trochenteri]|uniref:SDR family oxidoreductase n=1 Tax=Oceaniglobus trochenteri TaxID=2763260 RepID=UPI001CFFE787|nr:SDR family oxidoreductase [Oceaniglobus trochenteri]